MVILLLVISPRCTMFTASSSTHTHFSPWQITQRKHKVQYNALNIPSYFGVLLKTDLLVNVRETLHGFLICWNQCIASWPSLLLQSIVAYILNWETSNHTLRMLKHMSAWTVHWVRASEKSQKNVFSGLYYAVPVKRAPKQNSSAVGEVNKKGKSTEEKKYPKELRAIVLPFHRKLIFSLVSHPHWTNCKELGFITIPPSYLFSATALPLKHICTLGWERSWKPLSIYRKKNYIQENQQESENDHEIF